MPKLKTAPLTAEDIDTCLLAHSAFTFEMETLARLAAVGVRCEHSGTYVDPVTQKTRQFDIRGLHRVGRHCRLWLAVECKSIAAHCPLVAHTVSRKPAEAFVSGLVFKKLESGIPGLTEPQVVRLTDLESPYAADQPVAKSLDQVGFLPSGEPYTGDADIFEKVSQAVNSLRDLIVRGAKQWAEPSAQVFLPVLVVPEGRLWAVSYGDDGKRQGAPTQTERVSQFLNHSWSCEIRRPEEYSISHIEIVTPAGLEAIIREATPDAPHFRTLGSRLSP